MTTELDYKHTINLGATDFPMRGDLAKREPFMLEGWHHNDLYNKLRQIKANSNKFILHDGPPYANGTLHLGHAINKVLKDIVIRNKGFAGFDAPYLPGWDCHGLPIELNVEKKYGKSMSAKEFRDKCREYAKSQIEIQKKDFMRLGILANWNMAYTTMDYDIEAGTVLALGDIYKNNHLHQGVKPVHWCIACGSALAEAEVEYMEKKSLAVYVKFKFTQVASMLDNQLDDNLNLFAIIWTTTAWTLPANEAICIAEDINYTVIKITETNTISNTTDEYYILIASELVENTLNLLLNSSNNTQKIIQAACITELSATKLEGLNFIHPFYQKIVPIITGSHVTVDSGTGLVHTAPAHGMEDYLVGLQYKLPINNPVADNGVFNNNLPDSNNINLKGMNIWKSIDIIVDTLIKNNALLYSNELSHSYPHCWRHKTPLIFRTTAQWFINMENSGLRQCALSEVEKIAFHPKWGYARLNAMIKNRPDWCISRQRKWCTPMTFFVHKETNLLHPDSYAIIQQVASLIQTKGIDAWFDEDLTAHSLGISNPDEYRKITDTLDVWFDSGVTHLTVLKNRLNVTTMADLYLEGSDQHRGWFQSSLITSCAIKQERPYKQLLTHGFIVDGNGHKMSKSIGNIVSIETAVNKYGADLIRLWIASTDYTGEISYSDEIMKRVTDSYRRIRNTFRFLLANLSDFEYNTDKIIIDELELIDKYALITLYNIQNKLINELYPNYQFHLIVQELLTFCSEFLGGFYLDVLKDRLYTAKYNSKIRRSAQTVLYHILHSLLFLLSPIVCFTADEAFNSFYTTQQAKLKNSEDSHNAIDSIINGINVRNIIFNTYHNIPLISNSEDIQELWNIINNIRQLTLKELENSRTGGIIGSSLQAELTISVPSSIYNKLTPLVDELKFAYMVSKITLQDNGAQDKLSKLNVDTIKILVVASTQKKCERCWHYSDTIGIDAIHTTICQKCIENLE